MEKIRFFRVSKFSPVAAFACRTFGSPPYLSLSGSAAAPPSGGAKTWPRAERAGVGVFCWPLLLGRAWPVPYMARRNHYGAPKYRQAGTSGTHKCVPYRVWRNRRGASNTPAHPANSNLLNGPNWPSCKNKLYRHIYAYRIYSILAQ